MSANPNFGLPREEELYETKEPLKFKLNTTWSLTERTYTEEKSRPVLIWKNKTAIDKVTRSSEVDNRGDIVTEVDKAFAFNIGCNINDNNCECNKFQFNEIISNSGLEMTEKAVAGMVISQPFKNLFLSVLTNLKWCPL